MELERLIGIIPQIKCEERDGDYLKDGLLYCGKCNTAKQVAITLAGKTRVVTCLCHCEAEEEERKTELLKAKEEKSRIEELRKERIQDQDYRNWTFENDDQSDPKMTAKARKYVEEWEEMYADNISLYLWGDTGRGKSYFAAMIANALFDKGVPILMTDLGRIIAEMNANYGENKLKTLDGLKKYKLLVLDDLGVERESEYMMEQVYTVINARYKDGQPVIITSNIPWGELGDPKNMQYKRIYERIMEMCVPIKFDGENKRRKKAQEKMARAREVFAK